MKTRIIMIMLSLGLFLSLGLKAQTTSYLIKRETKPYAIMLDKGIAEEFTFENQLNVGTVLDHLAAFQVGDVISVEIYLTAVGIVQFEYGTAQSGFTATGFAHNAYRRAFFQSKTYVVHRFKTAQYLAKQRSCKRKIFLEISDFQYIFGNYEVFYRVALSVGNGNCVVFLAYVGRKLYLYPSVFQQGNFCSLRLFALDFDGIARFPRLDDCHSVCIGKHNGRGNIAVSH